MTTTLIDKALEEFRNLAIGENSERWKIEQDFLYAEKNPLELSSNIWQALDKATNLCSLLWSLKLDEEAGLLEDWKIRLTRMHRELASEIKP